MCTLRLIIVLLAVLAGACAGKKPATTPTRPTTAQVCADVTDPIEQDVCRRAEKIEREKAQDKALKAVSKKDTPAMKQAREELQHEVGQREKADKRERRMYAQADIRDCRQGSVRIINPRAIGNWSLNSSVKVRVINTHDGPISIDSTIDGRLVDGLCPGGSITLFRARNGANSDWMNFHYTASGLFYDGSLGIDRSQEITLSSWDWSSGRGEQFLSWEVRLQKVWVQK